jgi:DNA-binding transcriptional LysR family regulator
MDEIDLNSLKSLMIFKTLIENGTATRTAKVLGITQSGVSRSLAQLEHNLIGVVRYRFCNPAGRN